MEDELRKIDLIRERTRLGYAQARQLLEEAGGDVVSALILWERRQGEPRIQAGLEEAAERVRELVERGNRTTLRVHKGGRTYVQMPVTVGVVGTLLAPYLAVAGAAACLLTGCRVSVERRDQPPVQPASEDVRAAGGAASAG